jgi:hypothetical protein
MAFIPISKDFFTSSPIGCGAVPCSQLSNANSTPPYQAQSKDWLTKAIDKMVQKARAGWNTTKTAVTSALNWGKRKVAEGIDALKRFGSKLWNCVDEAAEASHSSQCIKTEYKDGEDTPPVTPSPKECSSYEDDEIIFVNGIQNSPEDHDKYKQMIANAFCRPVRGIYNATAGKLHGLVHDLGQAIGDKAWPLASGLFGGGEKNMAAISLYNTIYDKLNNLGPDEYVRIIAHSQGAIITANALYALQYTLLKEGRIGKMKKIKVITMGSAATLFPYGPRYSHWVFVQDPVTWIGTYWNPESSLKFAPCIWTHNVATYLKYKDKFKVSNNW